MGAHARERLTTKLLRMAYAQGFFPMPEGDGFLWYNPDPRAILPLDKFHLSRSLKRTLAREDFSATFDKDFSGVMNGASQRKETWITPAMKAVYAELHREGDAHSVEVWHEGVLVGGVYGVSLGSAFFAESMFHRKTDASKVALFHLVAHLRRKGFSLLEVQFMTPHLNSLGAIEISADEYKVMLAAALAAAAEF